MKNKELSNYLNQGIENIIRKVMSGSLTNTKEITFLLKYSSYCKKASKIRNDMESKGLHIPVFLISSITHSCNLHCKGCYARDNGICCDNTEKQLLGKDDWSNIFKQAKDIGISFHILAGGEPLTRMDVISQATKFPQIIFLIFTNGTLIDKNYLQLFNKNRNLVPVISIEGTESTTDSRRGNGVYKNVLNKIEQLKENKILFGTSITVTKENLNEVTSESFIKVLEDFGCQVIFFIEYVPINSQTRHLAFTDIERSLLEKNQEKLKQMFTSILFLSFPGDEKKMGGCLAAGRGFFHINPYGGAEACPFSPYSDRSLKDYSLMEVLESPFFQKLQSQQLVGSEHIGGCTLFEQENKVRALLKEI